jgi:hypothetical protein
MTKRVMQRGKQQVMYGLLPGKMFDFQGTKEIARVKRVRGIPDTQLNLDVILGKIRKDASAWSVDFRPDFSNDFLNDPNNFILLNPTAVEAELFPTVLLCQNRRCGNVTSLAQARKPDASCKRCKGQLSQLTFIKVHQCGVIAELRPPNCQKCHDSRYMALDTRNSERLTNFRWICQGCGGIKPIDSTIGNCRECQWPEASQQRMRIQKFRAGSTYYPRTVALLNLPERQISNFLHLTDWEQIVAAKYLGITSRKLIEFSAENVTKDEPSGGVTGAEMQELTERLTSKEITPEEFVEKAQELSQQRQRAQENSLADNIIKSLQACTGVLPSIWYALGQEFLEAVTPFENNHPKDLFAFDDHSEFATAKTIAHGIGFSRLALLSDFPMLTVSYGFSRTTYEPNQCYLRPFPESAENNGKFPIYVDRTQADAIWVSLDSDRVCKWLEDNDLEVVLPPGNDLALSKQGYFAQLFAELNYKLTLNQTQKAARMVFGLLHTLSHLSIRRASLLCGLDVTSLGEYLLPCALTFAISSNHRSGATIGALTALFEQVLAEWLNSVRESSTCVYDPVCYQQGGNCHACTHLAETSCSNFNVNLGRAFLFGGYDPYLGEIKYGYFDMPATEIH